MTAVPDDATGLGETIFKRAGIDRVDELGRTVDIHALRGTCATRLLRHGVGLAQVSKILGHADVRMTMRHYADLPAEDLVQAIDSVPAVEVPSPPPVKDREDDARSA